jgi:hypothetical protein
VICTLFILGHIFTFKHLCLHSITKILRNGSRAHFPFSSSDKTSSRSGQAGHSPEERVIGPGTSSTASLTMLGQGCPRPSARPTEPSRSGDATLNDAGAVHHRRATYPGRAQGPPGRRRCPTSRELFLPKARRPLGASCNALPTHAGGLGPHRAHTGRDACSPGSPQ